MLSYHIFENIKISLLDNPGIIIYLDATKLEKYLIIYNHIIRIQSLQWLNILFVKSFLAVFAGCNDLLP